MCGRKIDVEEGLNVNHSDAQKIESPKKIKKKSSESLTKDLRAYYTGSPERKHRVLVVHRKQFFPESESEE